MWKQSFSSIILARGSGIQEDAVIYFENEQNIIRSKVEGTQVYEIIINLNQEIETAQCTCPYFQSGKLCKHIAATMFRYETINSKANKISVISFIEGLDDNEVKDLLLNLILENSAIRSAIVATDSYKIQNLDLDTLKASIDCIIEMIENNPFGEDDWYDSDYDDDYDYFDNEPLNIYDELEKLEKDFELIVEQGHYQIAYDGFSYFLHKLTEMYSNEQNEESGSIFSTIINILKYVNHTLDSYQQKIFFYLIYLILALTEFNYQYPEMIEVWEEHFDSPNLLKERIACAEERINQLKAQKDERLLILWVLFILKTYKKLGEVDGERIQSINQYIFHRDVATYYIKELFEENKYEEVTQHASV